MTASGTARPRCLPRSTLLRARSSAPVTGGAAPWSSTSFSITWRQTFPTTWTSTSSWTMTQLARRRPCETGLSSVPLERTPHAVTPVSASWIHQVERFFAERIQKQLRRGEQRSVEELEARILEWIETFHADPDPFCYTRSADDFLASRKRFCVRDAEAATIEKTPWAAIQHKGPNWKIGTLGRFCPQAPLNLLNSHGVVTRKLALLRDWESDFHRRNGQLPIFGVGDQNSVHEARIASTGIHCWSAFLEFLAGQEGRGWARRIGLWTKTEVCRQAMVTVRQMRDA